MRLADGYLLVGTRSDAYRARPGHCPATAPADGRIASAYLAFAGRPEGGPTPKIRPKLRDGGGISGVVRNTAGKALGGICVIARGANRSRTESATGKNGRFTLSDLAPGHYQVEFTIGCGTMGNYAFQWWRGATLGDEARRIQVLADRVTTGIDPVLFPGGTVVGTVWAARRGGTRLSQVCVRALDFDLRGDARAVTGENGRYRLTGLASNIYALQFDATCVGSKPAFYVPQEKQLTINARQRHEVYNGVLPIGAGVCVTWRQVPIR